MPVSPYPIGPGLLLKAAAPSRFSLTAYSLTQVAIDLESGIQILAGDRPIHRSMHTFFYGSLAGLGAGLAVGAAGALLGRWAGGSRLLLHESKMAACLVGGLVGGWAHALLDGIMHSDVHPLRPFSEANPLLHVVTTPALEGACVLTGIVGAVGWMARRAMQPS